MALSRLQCVSLIGLEAVLIEVEVDVATSDKLTLVIVGLPDTAVRESKDRVLTAVKNSGFTLGSIYSTVNLAPGDLKKEGVLYDLPIALGLMRSSGLLKEHINLTDYLIVGELSLSGHLRPLAGALAIAMLARAQGKKGVLLPACNADEAALVQDIDIYGIADLQEAAQFVREPAKFTPTKTKIDAFGNAQEPLVDFSAIKGQLHAKRSFEIAAAGGHNLIMSGPPGCGKTLMAKALPSIMPPMNIQEALEVTRIHSIAGLLSEKQTLLTQRPFRKPHHTISYAGLIGGGSNPRPGEISLAHHGILFLDELPEFSRSVLEVLRQPLEDRKVTISRAHGNFTFPTNIMFVAAMNPCPCGYLGHPDKACKDSPLQIQRYQNKLSGPLLDRIDIKVDVDSITRYSDLLQQPPSESSNKIQQRVINARQVQHQRFQSSKTNAELSAADLKLHCTLKSSGWRLLQNAMDAMHFSARACDRILRVARTIADLALYQEIQDEHILESLGLMNASLTANQTKSRG